LNWLAGQGKLGRLATMPPSAVPRLKLRGRFTRSGSQEVAMKIGIGVVAVLASTGVALAQAQTPSISGNSWVAVGIIIGLVLLILFFIRASLRISQVDDTSDAEDEGVGVFEGIEEDDGKPKKRK
jgi:hypothetical protein